MLLRLKAVDGPARRLFCTPHAGGRAEIFASWSEWLPHDVDLWVAQLPSRWPQDGGARPADLRAVGKAIAGQIQDALATEKVVAPITLYGHSLGALVAFEGARVLTREMGRAPAALICAACNAPQRIQWRPHVNQLSDLELFQTCNTQFGGEQRNVSDFGELERRLLEPLRQDLALLDSYVYVRERKLLAPIHILAGEQDPSISDAGLGGWARHTSATCVISRISAGHYFADAPNGAARTAVLAALGALK